MEDFINELKCYKFDRSVYISSGINSITVTSYDEGELYIKYDESLEEFLEAFPIADYSWEYKKYGLCSMEEIDKAIKQRMLEKIEQATRLLKKRMKRYEERYGTRIKTKKY